MDLTASDERLRSLLEAATEFVSVWGIERVDRAMPLERPAEFDGLSITLNPAHDLASRTYYFIHSFGSIAGWTLEYERARAVFDELRDAKTGPDRDFFRLERALLAFRAFEERASEYSVSVMEDLGYPDVVPGFTLFFRADLEAITQYHREGRAPVWRPFLRRWMDEVTSGTRTIEPFRPRPVPPFAPRRIERQEVRQEQDAGD